MPKKTYKETHGTTRVGDFLRSIGKADMLSKLVDVGGKAITGNISGAISGLLSKEKGVTKDQIDYAIKMAEMDAKESEEVTKRWDIDSKSDSWLAKNIRPMIVAWLFFWAVPIMIFDSLSNSFNVKDSWVNLLITLCVSMGGAYMGSRYMQKRDLSKKD